jgi:hypothetical protein
MYRRRDNKTTVRIPKQEGFDEIRRYLGLGKSDGEHPFVLHLGFSVGLVARSCLGMSSGHKSAWSRPNISSVTGSSAMNDVLVDWTRAKLVMIDDEDRCHTNTVLLEYIAKTCILSLSPVVSRYPCPP